MLKGFKWAKSYPIHLFFKVICFQSKNLSLHISESGCVCYLWRGDRNQLWAEIEQTVAISQVSPDNEKKTEQSDEPTLRSIIINVNFERTTALS